LANYCKEHNLAVPPKENVGKILKRKNQYQEGREASGYRRTVWKGIRLREEYQGKDYDRDHTDHSAIPQPPKQFN
jgi:hypothetical protein